MSINKHYIDLCDKITSLLEEIIKSQNLPPNSLQLFSNLSSKGINKGKETSKSISIFEPEFPATSVTQKQGRNFVVMNIQPMKSSETVELLIRNSQFDAIRLPSDAEVRILKSDTRFKHVILNMESEHLYDYIRYNILYCLKYYESSNSFSCCSKFLECSDKKRCVHENTLYSKGCHYRRHLDSGRIFYGKNKNI